MSLWRFAAKLALFAALFGFSNGCSRPDAGVDTERPNVLLISVDTLRADHLGSYGYGIDTSPVVDQLAAEGVRFADATVQWPKTWPSMASMLTGTYPATNGVRLRPRHPLAAANVTLAEVLKEAGFQTGAVVANVNLGKDFGFEQGFDFFVESWVDEVVRQTGKATFTNGPGVVKRFTNAAIVTDQAIALLDRFAGGSGKPFFLWLHYMDPHGPYLPPKAYQGLFDGKYPEEPVELPNLPRFQHQPDPRSGRISSDLGFYKAQYDREIRYFDDQLSRVLETLAKHDRQNTLIVLTADHGESLGEQRYFLGHGELPYQSTAAVPLIMVLRGRLAAGRAVEAPVGLIDVLPTVLDLVALPKPTTLQGRSLLPMLNGDASAGPAYVFMESGHADPSQAVVRKGRWKLVHYRSPKEAHQRGREIELFDLAADPGERRNLATQHHELVSELRAALDLWLGSTKKLGEGTVDIDLQQLDERTKEMMRALGYLE